MFLGDGYSTCGAGHLGASTDRLFHMGYGGIKQEILDRMAQLNPADPEDEKRMISLKADLICNEAASDMIRRYAAKAREMMSEVDDVRKEELKAIAENCDQVAEGTPKTFWQALQALHFAYTMIQMESNGHSSLRPVRPVHVPLLPARHRDRLYDPLADAGAHRVLQHQDLGYEQGARA